MTRFQMSLLPVTLMAVYLMTSVTIAQEQRYPFGYRIGAATGANDDCCWWANDYCRKPFPVDPCPTPGCYPDCFARKPLPAIPCTTGCATANDYVRKCFPCPPGQCATPGLPRAIYSSRFRSATYSLK